MTEEQQDQLGLEDEAPQEEAAQQEPAPAEVSESVSAEEPAEGRKRGWTVAVAVIAAILALCTIVVCVAAAIAAFSWDGDEVSAPAPTTAPVATKAPGQAMIAIIDPDQGQVVDISQPIKVQGKGVGLPEGNVVVVAVDQEGDVLAEQPTTLQGADVGAGGAGTWSVELAVPVSGQAPG